MSKTHAIPEGLLSLVLVIVSVAAQPPSAEAQVNQWVRRGPEGSSIRALVADHESPTTVYAATEGGGVFKTDDSGATWTEINAGMPVSITNGLAIDRSNRQILYAATEYFGVYKTTNAGSSWFPSSSGLAYLTNGVPTVPKVFSVAVDPSNPDIVYAATSAPSPIFKSTDGGSTWTAHSLGLANQSINGIYVDPSNSSVLYATGIGVFKSANSGQTWNRSVLTVANYFAHPTINALAFDPVDSNRLYVAIEQGIYVSVDGGAQWNPSNTGLPINPLNPSALLTSPLSIAVDPRDRDVLIAGAGCSLVDQAPNCVQGEVYRSVDRGASWSRVPIGSGGTNVSAVAIASTSPRTIYAGIGCNQTQLSNVRIRYNDFACQGTVFTSSDNGTTWSARSSGLSGLVVYDISSHPSVTGLAFAATSKGVHRTSNGGVSWSSSSTGLTTTVAIAVAVAPSSPSTVYAAFHTHPHSVYRSIDSGLTWTPASGGLVDGFQQPARTLSLAVDPEDSNIVYAAANSGLFKTVDGGATWLKITINSEQAYFVAIKPGTRSTLYFGLHSISSVTGPSALYVSSNGGMTYEPTGLRHLPTFVTIDPINPTTLYAGVFSSTSRQCEAFHGVYKSVDGGLTWATKNVGLPGVQCSGISRPFFLGSDMQIDPHDPGRIYLSLSTNGGTLAGGMFVSTDAAESWTPVGVPPLTDIRTLATLATTPTTVLAGSNGGSVQSIQVVPPVVTAINPVSGSAVGSTGVTITGSGFSLGDVVTFGGVRATAVVYVNSNTLTAVTPAHAAGVVDVVVTSSTGVAGGLVRAFEYVSQTVPGAPTDVSASRGNGQVTVTFSAPQSNGGAPIIDYLVQASPGGSTATGASSPIVVTGLQNGTAYTFTVTARNSVGSSVPSVPSLSATPATVPGAPTDVVGTRGNGQVSVSFSAPASDGGAAIGRYTVSASPGGASTSGLTSPLIVTGLTNGVTYSFSVTATNAIGTGGASSPAVTVTPATVPGAPTSVVGTRGNGQVSVAFQAPMSSGGSPVTGFVVTASPGGATASGNTSPLVVSGLTNGESYTFTVVAANAVGTGALSAPSDPVTPATVPGPPTSVVATPGNGQATVAFTPPSATGGSPIVSYTVVAAPGGVIATGSASPIVVSGLTNGQSHTFVVFSTNTVGPGPSSSPSNAVTPTAVPPSVSVTPAVLRFAATKDGPAGALISVTGAQTLAVVTAGSPEGQWIATSNAPWAVVTNGTGTGAGMFSVAVGNPGNVIGGATNLAATITVTAPNAGTSATVPITLTITQQPGTTTSPVGQVDTPIQASTGAQGAIAITGWVVDDVGVRHVRIYRQCLGFDNQAACQTVLGVSMVLVGEASVISGARPDVEGLYPTLPAANSAGWGFLILSNLLPNIPASSASGGGVGTFTLYAVATDVEGNQKLLGRTINDAVPTTVTVANDVIAKPFGAIDTPGQGATVSGTLNNFGWALTPDPGTGVLIPTTGSTITVFIDGAPVGTATYNLCRGSVGNPVPAGLLCDDDVSSIFRNAGSFRNLDAARGPIGLRTISTSALTNGPHTISWGVTDSANRSEGIGSRYFNVLNSSADAAADGGRSFSFGTAAEAKASASTRSDATNSIARTGYDLQSAFTPLEPNADGVPQVRIPEHGRVELQIPGVVDGALIVNGEARDLPVGVGIDRERGLVTWVAGAGYLGTYRLSFVVQGPTGSTVQGSMVDVTVVPATTSDAPIRMHVDRIDREGQVITLHGWGLDPQAATGSGFGAVHVWARRLVQGPTGAAVEGAKTVFLGVATLGLARPDVAEAHGAQFPNAGFVFQGVLPDEGEWDVTAYVWVSRTGRFEDARTVRIR